MIRTFPQEDLTFSFGVRPFNSSASPHVQSLHAFRLSVIPQSVTRERFYLTQLMSNWQFKF